MKLDVSSFKKAIEQLEIALKYCSSELAENDENVALLFRAAAIKLSNLHMNYH